MKHSLLTVLAALALGVVGTASLEAQPLPAALRVNVPFEFGMGGKTLPAGSYMVLLRPSGVVNFVPEDGGSSGSVALTTKGASGEKRGGPVLIFNRYGDQRFLAQVSNGSESVKFGKSRAEKQAAKATPGAGETINVESVPSASRP